MIASSSRCGRSPETRPPAIPPSSEGGAISQKRRHSILPPRQCAIEAVKAEAALIATLAPAPAAAELENSRTTGRRRLPSTRPATPPATATQNDQTATQTSSGGD